MALCSGNNYLNNFILLKIHYLQHDTLKIQFRSRSMYEFREDFLFYMTVASFPRKMKKDFPRISFVYASSASVIENQYLLIFVNSL